MHTASMRRKTKRKFDLSVVTQSWLRISAFSIGVQILVLAIIVTCSHTISLPSVVGWSCAALINYAVRLANLTPAKTNSGLIVNNFKFVRSALASVSGLLYGASGYLFMADLSPAGQTLFCVAMLISTYASIPIFYNFKTGFCIQWVLTWVPLGIFEISILDPVLVVVVAGISFFTGLALCGIFTHILANAFTTIERMTSQATTLGAENSNMKIFFLAAHHDLAQPLTAIEYAIQSLGRIEEKSPPAQEAIRNIRTSSATLSRLIGDIIQYEKVTSRNEPLNVAPTPLDAIIDRVVRQVEGLAEDKEIGIWARPTTRIALVDGFLLERVVRNLVENAIRNTASGRVVVAARPRGENVSIEVWDTGTGIAPENIGNVFDLFHQNGNRDEKKSGMGHGIGLTIVRTLCAKMGATVVVNSIPNHGTVFRVLVPAWRPTNEDSSRWTDARQKPRYDEVNPFPDRTSSLPWKGVTIGLLEDDATLRNQISKSFLSRGARVFQGKSSAEIVAAINGLVNEVDVVVTDWNLGAETGEFAWERLASLDGFSAKWIVISGDIESSDADRLRAKGVFVLMKPFGQDRLISVVNSVLS